MTLLSVIIPTYHRNDLLKKCLDHLSPGFQTISVDKYEVIVTDDGTKPTAEKIILDNYSWVKWVSGPRKGPAANRNNGAKGARGEWLVFIDDDCIPDKQWLDAYAKAIIANPLREVFEGRTYAANPRKSLADTAPINETGGFLWSCNFAIKKKTFELIRGFDERFPYAAMEDVDLSLRLKESGYIFSFVKDAAVCHPWRPRGGWRKLKQHQESTLIYLSIHPNERRRINSRYYLSMVFRGLMKTTIPYVIKLKGKGLKEELLQHLSFLQIAFYLFMIER